MNKKSISTNDGLKGGFLKGKPHYDKNGNSLGGIKAVVTDQGGQLVELEGGEAILRKSAMESDKEFVVKGTPKEIASTLNQEFDGRAIGDSEAEILAKYREGGELIKRADGSYSKRGLWDNIRDNIGSGRKPTKEMLRQEALIKEKYYLGGDINGYSVNEFEKYLEDKYNANIDLGDYKKYIYLSKISIPKEIRGLGIGTEIMNEIIAYADNNNRLVTLTPSTDYGATSISRLKEFYKKFGFIENKGRNKNFEISQSMYRVPLNDKYHLGGDMSKHLAPNGKPSNLTHEQWHLVRTPEFKAWFGDFELAYETGNYDNVSKVIDDNGEPLVVYRGDSSSNKKGYIFNKGFNRMGYLDKDRLPNQYFFYFVDKYEVADAYGQDQVATHNDKVEYTGKGKKWESKVTSYFLNIKNPIDLTPKNPLFISYEDYEKQVKKNIIDKKLLYQLGYRYGLELSRKELNKILEKTLGKDYLLDKDYTGRYEESFIESFKKDETMINTYSHFIEHKNRDYNSKFLYRFYARMIEKKFDGLVFLEDTNWNGGNFYGEINKKYASGELKFDYNRWVEKPKVFACLESNQIKLADGSNTTFDINNDDIRFAEGGSIPEQGTLYTKDKKTKLEYIKNGSDYEFIVYELEDSQYKRHNKNKAIMNYNQFIDYLDSESFLHDKFKEGGSIKPNFSKMSESEIKEFYDSPEGRKLDAETYSEWKKLVNMSKSELENFYNSEEGKEAGLSQEEANRQGIDSGRESARWIMKMKDIPYTEWTSNMWRWAKKQISFIKRMSGMKGELYDDNGNKTRKHTSLLIWGHNPTKKFAEGGGIESNFKANFELWVDKLNRNRQLPIEFTTSKSIEGVHKDSGYGDSYYIMIFDENWNQYAKLRFSGHSVSNINRVKDEIHNPNISRFYEIVSRAMSKKQQEENPEELIKFKDGGSIEKNKEMEKKEIFYAYTNGKKYEIKAYDNLTYESFTNGSSNGSGSALNREDLKRTLYKKIEGSKLIDGINYIIVKDDILGEKEYDYTDYESVKELTKSLIEKYNNEVDSTGKKNKGTKINIEARIDSLFRLVDENPSKYLQDFIDFNNSLPKSFSISANIIFEKFDYSSNDNIINYLVETKKNPFDFYNISPYKLPKTKNFKVSPNDKVFMGIHDDFIGNDFLRPIMTGTYFSEKGVVSTNAHILLFTKNRGGEESFEGVYCHTKKCIEESKDGKIEGKFPNYEAVIPSTQDYTKNVNAEYLLTYLKNANKYRLFNSVTHASILYFETSEGTYKIGVNTELLSSCIEAMIELGHKEISLNFTAPNRAITITPRGKTNEDARDLKTDFALCMPVMISEFRDIYIFMYDLDTNCSKYIYNESIYCFDYEHTERENFKKEVREVKELKEQLKSELAKGTEHEMEHLETLKKVAEHEITPEEAVVETAKTHISENPEYYEDLAKMETENEESIPDLIEGLKVLLEYAEGIEKTELENTIEGLKLLLDDDKFAEGGELNNNSMFFEPSKSEEEEEKRIMESQFGKNI